MKRVVKGLIFLWVLLILIPVGVFLISGGEEEGTKREEKRPKLADDNISVKVYFKESDELTAMPLPDFLIGVVAAEMPADFSMEALKAQAIAARTDIIYRMERAQSDEGFRSNHEGGDVCDDHTHCMAYISPADAKLAWGDNWYGKYYNNIKKAVYDTDASVMLYDGEVINAVFHSTSSGRTESAKNAWGSDVEYLRGVDSPGDTISPRYETTKAFSAGEFYELAAEECPGLDPELPVFDILKIMSRSDSGYVLEMTIGEYTVTGAQAREMFSLRSSAFEVEFTEEGEVRFLVKGYGHGVGLSQYGAQAMALDGKSAREILSHYYSGITFATVGKK